MRQVHLRRDLHQKLGNAARLRLEDELAHSRRLVTSTWSTILFMRATALLIWPTISRRSSSGRRVP